MADTAHQAEVETLTDEDRISYWQGAYERMAARNVELDAALRGISSLIGNVDHSQGGGENAARMYGGMLNDIRELAARALPASPSQTQPE